MIEGGCDGIHLLEALVQRWRAMLIGISVQHTSQRRIGWGSRHKPIEQCLQVETAPCHNQNSLATLPYLIEHLLRTSKKLGSVSWLMRQKKIQQMMWHLGLLRHERLCSTDIHVCVDLA
jgi:hypothetical protein